MRDYGAALRVGQLLPVLKKSSSRILKSLGKSLEADLKEEFGEIPNDMVLGLYGDQNEPPEDEDDLDERDY